MLTIRPERPDQADVVALLDALDAYLASLYPPEANHILDVQALLASDVRFLVARRDGVAVGTGAVRLGPGYGEVKRMYVAPTQRGQRIAEQLLQALEAQLRSEGIAQARLETGRDQAEALRLYQRCGYTRCAPFGGYPDNGLSVFLGKAL
ncbi:GNAT family N-acetyltransferase [Rubrivivax sp. RP6-9]|uniref:GNAT family N-acetyltransferase n=1 Tax=Rubrivivax sp. RP6-9 TaxID=3415750 RepID=UPI003CC6CF4D